MNYKVWILVILSSTKAYASPKKALDLLDQVHEAQAYWEAMARDKKVGLWKRPPHKWLSRGWKSEIAFHQKDLAEKRAKLISLLALVAENPQSAQSPEAKNLYRKIHKAMGVHGVPSHFNRRWLSYAGMGAGFIAAGLYLHRFKTQHTLFILPPGQQSIASSLHDYCPVSGNEFVIDTDGTQYWQVKKSEEHIARAFLADKKSIYHQLVPQWSLCWYNEQGEHKVWEFIRKHGIEPVKSMWRILKNDNPPQQNMFTSDLDAQYKQYEKNVNETLQKAAVVPQTAEIVHQGLNGKSLDEALLKDKRNMCTNIIYRLGHIGKEIAEETNRALLKKPAPALPGPDKFMPLPDNPRIPNFGRVIIHDANLGMQKVDDALQEGKILTAEVKNILDVGRLFMEKNGPLLELLPLLSATKGSEMHFLGSIALNTVNTYAESAKLNIELSATLPLVLVTYLGYVITSKVYRHATALTILTPLKTDLLSLELVLNKERYTKDCAALSVTYKGEFFYLIERLKRYKHKLPATYRAIYRKYLDDLQNKELLPEQKMTLVRCLFRELEPLFAKN